MYCKNYLCTNSVKFESALPERVLKIISAAGTRSVLNGEFGVCNCTDHWQKAGMCIKIKNQYRFVSVFIVVRLMQKKRLSNRTH